MIKQNILYYHNLLHRSVIIKLIFTGIYLTTVLFTAGCKKTPTEPQPVNLKYPLKGVSLSPRSFQANDLNAFFAKSKQTGEVITWAGDWYELSDTATNSGANFLISNSSNYRYIPIIEAQFFDQSTGSLLRPLNDSIKTIYKNIAVRFAEKYKPEYLALGIEVNILFDKSPADFNNFAGLFSEIYDSIKVKSTGTKVFTIFNLEKMKGLKGGLFGGTNDTTKAEWFLLDDFAKSDLIAFTSYPDLIFKDPSNMPANYYNDIKLHTSKPIAFSETGWHSDASPAGWESSDSEQASYVNKFFNLTKDLDKELEIWSFMYDPDTFEPFKSMGLLRRSDGTEKPSWNEWINGR